MILFTAEPFYRIHSYPAHEYICADNATDDLFHDCFRWWWFDNDFIAAFVELSLKIETLLNSIKNVCYEIKPKR